MAKPDHYNKSEVSPWDLITSLNLNFDEGNVIKYLCRYKYKDGIKDLYKARDYLEHLISTYEDRINKW